MVEISFTYDGDLRCQAAHGPSGSTLRTDAPADNMGKGELFSPTDLVATALATCILTTMAIYALNHGIEFAKASGSVTKEMTAQAPRRIARLAVTITVAGSFSAEQKSALENAAHTCPVKKSLHADVEAPIQIQWEP